MITRQPLVYSMQALVVSARGRSVLTMPASKAQRRSAWNRRTHRFQKRRPASLLQHLPSAGFPELPW